MNRVRPFLCPESPWIDSRFPATLYSTSMTENVLTFLFSPCLIIKGLMLYDPLWDSCSFQDNKDLFPFYLFYELIFLVYKDWKETQGANHSIRDLCLDFEIKIKEPFGFYVFIFIFRWLYSRMTKTFQVSKFQLINWEKRIFYFIFVCLGTSLNWKLIHFFIKTIFSSWFRSVVLP